MIPRRVWINLGAFFLLFAVLVNWAVRNIISLDQIDRPYRITASFESSPGLQANVAVTYLGVQVGTIDRVALAGGEVLVDLDIDRGRVLPEGLNAAVLRKSAVGEPYVSLEAPDGYGGGGPYIDPGDRYHIPIERTRVPLSYADLFGSLDDLLGGVPADDLEVVVHELAVGLEGRGPQLRTIIGSTADLTGTLAERSALFDALAEDLTQLTDAVASQSAALGSGFDNVTALVETLATSRADIETLLTEAPRFGDRVAELLDGLYPNLTCAFESTGNVFATAGTPQNVANLLAVLAGAAAARDAFDSAVVPTGEGGADGPYLGGSFTLGVGPAPPAYPAPVQFEPTPPRRACDAGPGPDPAVAADGSTAAGGEGTGEPSEGAAPGVPGRPSPEGPAFPESSDLANRDQSFPLAGVLLAFGAALALVALVTFRPWRLLVGAARDDGGDDTPPEEAPDP